VTTTPLQQLQTEQGVEFYEWDGWPWPSSFGDAVAEYLAVRNGVGIVDSSGLRKWELRGPDALRAADRIVTQDCSQMPVGRVHYTPVAGEDGMMLDDITVFRLADDRVMLVSGLLASEAHFAAPIGDLDVALVPLSEERASLQLQGPRSRDTLAGVTDVDLGALAYFHCAEGSVAGEDCIVSRTGYSGELGYEIFCPPSAAAAVWTALLDAGTEHGIRPYGLEAADYLRVESGLIFVTFDYSPGEWSPFEMGLGWAVKTDAGDFVGRDALRRLAGEPPRRRVTGIAFDGDGVPEPGAAVGRDGADVGTVTVAVRSSLFDRVLGLALIDGALAASPGTRVQAGGSAGEIAALPFHDPQRARPRA
jgi:aminomethyltransferase